MSLAVTTARLGDRIVVTLGGAIDLASRDQLLDTGRQALLEPDLAALVIDLAAVSFLDSSGIGALVALAGECHDTNRAFSLRAPSAAVTRVLTISGLLQVWPIE